MHQSSANIIQRTCYLGSTIALHPPIFSETMKNQIISPCVNAHDNFHIATLPSVDYERRSSDISSEMFEFNKVYKGDLLEIYNDSIKEIFHSAILGCSSRIISIGSLK